MIVVFNPTTFRNRHPFFTEQKISDEALQWQFDVACSIIFNGEDTDYTADSKGLFIPYDPDSNVYDRDRVLDALTCHLATLALRDPNQSGAVNSASEGSVSVSYGQLQGMGGDFFNQTPCGQVFWQLMKSYRIFGGIMSTPSNYHPWG